MVDKIERSGKIKVLGIDPKHSGLVIVEIPLNAQPPSEWIDCFQHPSTWTPSLHPPAVNGKSIIWRAVKESVDKDIKWIFSYIEQANACYERVLKEKEKERERIEKEESARKKELEEIQKKLENL